ncbi:hypothetical protein [Francisella philomiragia]|uniref:hypothetical protein n=1 Tax=Francisella philomiragia TaxID=28110 RepID=UPI001904F8DF|nr:hypothetical protein [Francisella philomiragia]MBK2257601.1 hypothetical protein [Francisella philomiragia]MBK2270313.1 hypothetical protein [Francisella philomiragia]MBK2272135.1 hypothetical protein [Francisella philomiragia]MBK2275979.1 hypothetical protein [Francisella philomiragia]MBK2295514.1 hypothetical protein [Francisella philomiragia]
MKNKVLKDVLEILNKEYKVKMYDAEKFANIEESQTEQHIQQEIERLKIEAEELENIALFLMENYRD